MVQIDLESMDAAELAILSKMAHVPPEVRGEAVLYLRALVGPTDTRIMQAEAQTYLDQIRATDAVLYMEAHR